MKSIIQSCLLMFFFSSNFSYSQNSNLVLAKANSECGEGIIYYFSEESRLAPQELDWLKTTLRYLHSGEEINSTSFEDYSEQKVSAAEINHLLTQKKFTQWAEKEIATSIKNLTEKRSELMAKKDHLGSDDQLIKSKVVQDYLAAQSKLKAQLEKKFKVKEKDNGVTCD